MKIKQRMQKDVLFLTLKDIPSMRTCSVFSGSTLRLGWKDG